MKRFMKHYMGGLVVLTLLGLSSCIDDSSTGASNPLSTISSVQQLEAEYKVDRWDTLRIAAPEVTQANTTKPLQYRWEINGETVSTEKDLSYVCRDYGNFLCRLTVSNEDGNYYNNFQLNVQYSYRTGVYILAEDNAVPIVTYVPAETNKSIEYDVLSRNNEDLTFSGTPQVAGFRLDFNNKQELFLAAGSPTRVYAFDGNTMQLLKYGDAAGTVTALFPNYSGTINNYTRGSTFSVVENGTISEISGRVLSLVLTNSTRSELTRLVGTPQLGSTVLPWARTTDNTFNGQVFYDNGSHSLVIHSSQAQTGRRWMKLFDTESTGLTLTGMTTVNNRHDVAVFLKDPATHKYYHMWVYPGGYAAYTASVRNASELKQGKTEIPSTAGMTDDSKFIGSNTTNLVYYSSGNNIYVYSVLSRGNFPSTPTFSCNSGETIASMILSSNESELYVATNPTSGAGKGSLYCFDVNTRTLKWHHAEVSGKILQLMYRP